MFRRHAMVIGVGSTTVAGLVYKYWKGSESERPENGEYDRGFSGQAGQALRNPREADSCRALGLPTPTEASLSDVVLVKGLFSSEEVDHIVNTAKGLQNAHLVGDVRRDEHGHEISRSTNMVWRTTYLHTNGEFSRRLPEVREKLLSAIFSVDVEKFGLIEQRCKALAEKKGEKSHDTETVLKNHQQLKQNAVDDDQLFALRTVEFHEYWPGGQLRSRLHYDAGSYYTIDVCLASPSQDFCGGQLATPCLEATISDSPEFHVDHGSKFNVINDFEKGDAAIFLSHKYHNVLPVTSGKRMVLVAELWEGPSKQCPHRCLTAGECSHSLAKAQMDGSRQHLAILG